MTKPKLAYQNMQSADSFGRKITQKMHPGGATSVSPARSDPGRTEPAPAVMSSCGETTNNRSGVALVLVLGFLAILTLMAVTFAISQRTERLVSRSHLEQVKTEMLLETALARALTQIEELVGSDPYPDRLFYHSTNGLSGAFDIDVWDFIPSVIDQQHASFPSIYGPWRDPQTARWTDTPSGDGRIAFYAVETSGFIDAHVPMDTPRGPGFSPAEIRPVPEVGDNDQLYTTIRTDWFRLFDQPELALAHSNVNPDYLFPFSFSPPEWDTIPVVLDQANDGVYRYVNQDGREDQLSVPTTSGWANQATPVDVPNWLSAYGRGEDTEYRLNLDTHNGDLAHIFRGNWMDMLDHFSNDASLFPGTNPSTSNIENPWDTLEIVSRAMCDLFGQYNIGKGAINTFWSDRFRSDFAFGTNENDEDDGNYQGRFPYLQPGLYITQIWAEGMEYDPQFDEDGEPILGTQIWIDAELEFANLFDFPIDLTMMRPLYRLDIRTFPSGSPFTGKWGWIAGGMLTEESQLANQIHIVDGDNPNIRFIRNQAGQFGNNRYLPASFSAALGNQPTLGPGQVTRISFSFLLDFDPLTVDNVRVFNRIGAVVRQVGPRGRYIHLNYANIQPGHEYRRLWWQTNGAGEYRYQADDPRLFFGGLRNPVPTSYAFVFDPGTPLGQDWFALGQDTSGQPGRDGTRKFYSVNYPNPSGTTDYPILDSVSHIGRQSLSNNRQWTTIPLVGSDPLAVDVARYFVMKPESYTNRQGRININSPFENVIASGFMAANTNMDGSGTNALTEADARSLAQLIIQNRPAGGYTNTVDVWRSATRAQWGNRFSPSKDKFQTEEVIARSMHLFTTRQQIYTVFLTAQELAAGEPSAESRAMAVVWRDPFRTDGQGRVLKPDDPGYNDGRHRVRVLSYRKL